MEKYKELFPIYLQQEKITLIPNMFLVNVKLDI